WFQPAETFEGMYRTYKRMRREIERIDMLFPETRTTHRRDGTRRCDMKALRRASWHDRWLWRFFHVALALGRLRYPLQRLYYQHLSRRSDSAWGTVPESKCLHGADSA